VAATQREDLAWAPSRENGKTRDQTLSDVKDREKQANLLQSKTTLGKPRA